MYIILQDILISMEHVGIVKGNYSKLVNICAKFQIRWQN